MYEDIDAKKDLLVLGIQNKEQLEMFKQGVQKIYYIDSTQNQKIWVSPDNYYGTREFNPFVPDAPFLHPLKTSENLWLSNVFRG